MNSLHRLITAKGAGSISRSSHLQMVGCPSSFHKPSMQIWSCRRGEFADRHNGRLETEMTGRMLVRLSKITILFAKFNNKRGAQCTPFLNRISTKFLSSRNQLLGLASLYCHLRLGPHAQKSNLRPCLDCSLRKGSSYLQHRRQH